MLEYIIIGTVFIFAFWCIFISFFVWLDDFTKINILKKEEKQSND